MKTPGIDIKPIRTMLGDEHINTVIKSGLKALNKLRDEKVIKAFGAGVNEWQVCQTLAERGDFDLFLLAGRYTLLEQTESLNSFLPMCEKRGECFNSAQGGI